MDQDSYEYECMRAELLGLPKPDKKPEHVSKIEYDDDDEINSEVAKELDDRKENLKAVGGGLAELNSILSVTQKKLNSFKTNFGSLKDLFRNLSSDKSCAEDKTSDIVSDVAETDSKATTSMTQKSTGSPNSQGTLAQETDSQVNKLDKLVMQAEEAELRMAHQNYQIRKCLR